MAAAPPSSERRRPRRGSIERPINGRLYRGTWLLVGLPLLLLAFSVAQPSSLQPPNLPPAFDRDAAARLAHDLAFRFPSRAPGTDGAAGAARWFRQQLEPYGYVVRDEPFSATVPGRGRVRLVNLVAERRSARSSRQIVVMAHRDDSGLGPGLDDDASGTAALIELARAYAPARGAARLSLPYSLVFLSTDGGVAGGVGAARFAAESTPEDVLAVINLDAVAGSGRPRLVLAGDTARSPTAGLVETLRAELVRETGVEPNRASALQQLVDLGFPFSLHEQAPFVSRGIPAVTVTTGGDRPPGVAAPVRPTLDVARLGQIGRATQNAVDAMEQGIPLSQSPSSYVFLGQRVVRGWAIEIVLVAMLLPFLAAAVDLFARLRRRRVHVAPALRSYRSRLAFWVWVGGLFLLFGAVGIWPGGGARPPWPASVTWPASGLVGLAVLAGIGWLVARDRLLPRRPVLPEEELAGHAGALLALSVAGLLVVATNPFALVFLLPSLHVWLWLPQVHSRGFWARAAVLALGFAGPALLVWSFAARYGLGWDAPWYLAWLFSIGYAPLPIFAVGLAWLAAAGQLAAIAGGRYVPYPTAAERPPRGPIRELVRRLVLAQRRRRRLTEVQRRAMHG